MIHQPLSRRSFVQTLSLAGAAVALPRGLFAAEEAPAFKISLAQWSLHRTIFNEKKITNLDFAQVAKEEFGIEAIEYVNQFFKDKAQDEAYLSQLKQRGADHGVKTLLIMVDGEGNLGDPTEQAAQRRSRIIRSGSMPPSSSVATRSA